MILKAEDLQKLFPNNKNIVVLTDALNKLLPKYEINTVERVCAFLAQCGHESNGFTVLTENLNYSAAGLLATFAKYFTLESSAQYARQPEKIASKVYANRMGNGNESSKDGFTYRGRGAIQLTGHDNYQAFATAIGMSLADTVAYCSTTPGAIESAMWFWKKTGLNEIADKKDLVTMTKKINGGLNGFVERQAIYTKAIGIIK